MDTPIPQLPSTNFEPTHISERWNIERSGDDLLVCFNLHDKGEKCEYERFVRASPEALDAKTSLAKQFEDQRSAAWTAVAKLLDEIDPAWSELANTGEAAALAKIRALADAGSEPEDEETIDDVRKAYALLFKENARLLACERDAVFKLIKGVLASEIECSVFEQHVQPALEIARTAHWSDCATNNAPALPAGPCDCGASSAAA